MSAAAPSAAPASVVEYSFRRSVSEREQTFSLRPDALVISTPGGGEERIALSAVRRVHLRSHRSRRQNYHECRIKLEDGRTVFLQDMHHAGGGTLESRGDTFTPFVRALHQALLPYREGIRFEIGSLGSFIGAVLVTPVVVAMAVLMLLAEFRVLALGCALTLLAMLPVLPRSRPRRYPPESPPAGLLP